MSVFVLKKKSTFSKSGSKKKKKKKQQKKKKKKKGTGHLFPDVRNQFLKTSSYFYRVLPLFLSDSLCCKVQGGSERHYGGLERQEDGTAGRNRQLSHTYLHRFN